MNRADSNRALMRDALDKVVSSQRPAVIRVPCKLGTGESPWKYLTPVARTPSPKTEVRP
jgi:hypothetical protein